MQKVRLRAALLSAAGIAGFLPGAAHAGGFYLQEQSVRGAGRAYSGEVSDTGAASLWWNPASIAGTEGFDGEIGFSAILPRGQVVNQNTRIIRPAPPIALPVGGAQVARNPIDNGYLPTGAIAYGLSPRLAVGLALTSPYSFTTNYDADSWTRYTADRTKLRTYDIQPSIAFMPVDGLRVGAALNIEYSKATLSTFLPNFSVVPPFTPPADGFQELNGNGWDFGWSAGVQYTAGPLTVGASYKSPIKHKLSGSIATSGLVGLLAPGNGTAATTATFETPWQATFGGRLKLNDALTLNAQATRFGWSKFDAIYLGAPVNVALPEQYRDTWAISGGFDLALSPRLTLRGGAQFDQTPTVDGHRDARVPDSDRWNFAGGASYAMSKAFTVDVAANYLKLNGATIDRATVAFPTQAGVVRTPILTDGRLEEAHVIVLSIGGRVHF